MWLDIKYALRQLLQSPKFSALTLLVLIGGLFVSLYSFSFLNSVLYKDLPLPEGDTILHISSQSQEDADLDPMPAWETANLIESQTSFAQIGRYVSTFGHILFEQTSKRLSLEKVDSNFFEFAKVQPLMGRTLQAEDYQAGAEPVVVLSYVIWQSTFNGQQDIVGQIINLNNQLTTVIGVMPEGFAFPVAGRAWQPLSLQYRQPQMSNDEWLSAYGRLNKGTSVEQAETELSSLLKGFYAQKQQALGRDYEPRTVAITSFPSAQVNGAGGIVFTFINGVALCILLLACINVGNLLLARALEKNKETAIRAALGAPTKRLISQLMWEGSILTILGSVLAVLLAGAALSYTEIVLQSHMADNLAFWWHWGMDTDTLFAALVFAIVTLFFACFLPACKAATQDMNATLRDGTRGAQGKKAGRLSKVLLTAQIFLISTLMLIGGLSAFLSQTIINMDMGVDFKNSLDVNLTLDENRYTSAEQKLTYYQLLKAELEQQDSISDVSLSAYLGKKPVYPEGQIIERDQDKPQVDVIELIGNTQSYGPYLLEGRHLEEQDHRNAMRTAVISDSMAKRYWPNASPIGEQIDVELKSGKETHTIVGVVTNRMNVSSLFAALDKEDEIYTSALQGEVGPLRVTLKHFGDSQQAQTDFYHVFYRLDHASDPGYFRSKEDDFGMLHKMAKTAFFITFGCAFFALFLALTGIYGLSAGTVYQRYNEIGIRRAVGATDRAIVSLFVKQGSKLLVLGSGLALLFFVLIAYLFHNFTEQLVPAYIYPMLACVVTVLVASAVLLAIYFPTRNAVVLEPSQVLRYG
ncbi:ABC transporter permease [Pseudoalteromonas phenolica]|uniref:ABC transporter permease n=1 Tax=Pseudoalteromonas phenolica TaxID=161398 RepID=UPI001486BF60|nr:ABC transporter permease [Pseudoalteromonas phenolica]